MIVTTMTSAPCISKWLIRSGIRAKVSRLCTHSPGFNHVTWERSDDSVETLYFGLKDSGYRLNVGI